MSLSIITNPFSDAMILSISALIIRIAIGGLMVIHGMPKLFGQSRKMLRDGMKQVGIPGPLFDIAGILEFIGGLALIFGFLTRIAAILFVFEMIGTTLIHITKLYNAPINRGIYEQGYKATKGFMFGWELDMVILVSALALFVIGPGIISLDYLLFGF